MLYLAEVQKKTGFMGTRTELKLLARQQAEHSWNPVPGDDIVPVDGGNEYAQGALVLVEVSANRQVQHIQEAGRPLVGILQNFSRLRERFRTQEEEIEGWKQSLVYQAQELTRREEELYDLEQQAQEFVQQRQELDRLWEEITPLQEQISREQQALANARQEFQAERQRWEELKASQRTGLSPEQIQQVDQVVQQLQATLTSSPALHSCLEIIQQQQDKLTQAWQWIEENAPPNQAQGELQHRGEALKEEWQRWHQTQAEHIKLQQQILSQRDFLQQQTDWQQQLQTQVQTLEQLSQELQQAAEQQGGTEFAELLHMPIPELEGLVEVIRKELKNMTSFVDDQEEELAVVRQTIEELRLKMSHVSEFERLQLAGDLESEEQSYQLLNQTLIGQRQRLYEKQYSLKKHEDILHRRQDQPNLHRVDFPALLGQAQGQLQQLQALWAAVQQQCQNTQAHLAELEARDGQRQGQLEQWHHHLQEQEKNFHQDQIIFLQNQGQATAYRQVLPDIQAQVNRLREILQQEQESRSNGHYKHLLGELHQVVNTLTAA